MSAPQLPDRCTIEQVHAAMSPGLPDHTAAMAAPVEGGAPDELAPVPMSLPPVPGAGSKHTGPV